MDFNINTPATPEALATQFNVNELEPRLENSVWGHEPDENPEPACITNGTCTL